MKSYADFGLYLPWASHSSLSFHFLTDLLAYYTLLSYLKPVRVQQLQKVHTQNVQTHTGDLTQFPLSRVRRSSSVCLVLITLQCLHLFNVFGQML